jgi:hypothetical protein
MAEKESFDLESVYDAEIAPLMTKIIEICKAHKLPMFATFLYVNDPEAGDEGVCTTNLMFGDERPVPQKIRNLEPSLRSSTGALRLTVKDKTGAITSETVIMP